MKTISPALEISKIHLEKLCEKWVQENLNVLGAASAKEAFDLLTQRYQDAKRTSKKLLPISFSIFALRTFAMVLLELTGKGAVSVFHVPRGNGGLPHVTMEGEIFFGDQTYVGEEYLVDYYVCPIDQKLCPLLTMESEEKTNGESLEFKDLDKLLSVASPRRIYFGQVSNKRLSDAEAVISSRLSSAYQSQIIGRGDQIAIILNVIGGKEAGFKFYSFDIERRLISERYIPTAKNHVLNKDAL